MNQDLAPVPMVEDISPYAPAVRAWTTEKLRILIEVMSPFVDGSLGEVNVGLARVYVIAIKELNRLYRVYEPPQVPEPEVDPEEEARAAQRAHQARLSRVLAQIEDLRNRV